MVRTRAEAKKIKKHVEKPQKKIAKRKKEKEVSRTEKAITKMTQQEKYEMFRAKDIASPYLLDLEALKDWGLDQAMDALVSEPVWRYTLMDFDEACYRDEVCQALSTLVIPRYIPDPTSRVIKFTVSGVDFDISLDDISRILGFDDHDGGPHSTDNKKMLGFEHGQDEKFWTTISDSAPYEASRLTSNSFFTPEMKILQFIIAKSVCGRWGAASKVTAIDLLCLYSLLTKKKVHMGLVIADLLRNQCHPKVKKLFVGPYLHRIIRSDPSVIPPTGAKLVGKTQKTTKQMLLKIYKSYMSQKGKGLRAASPEDGEEDEALELGEARPSHGSIRALLQEVLGSLTDFRHVQDERWQVQEARWKVEDGRWENLDGRLKVLEANVLMDETTAPAPDAYTPSSL